MSWLLDIRYRLEYALLLVLIGIVRLCPLDLASDISARITQMISRGGRRHRNAIANLEVAYPEKTPEQREQIAMEMWDNIGRVIIESMLIDRILSDPERIEIENLPMILRYKDKMGATIAATMHMGNWELASWPLAVAGSKTAAVYRLVKNPYVEAYLQRKRKTLFPGGLFGKGGAKGRSTGFATARMLGRFLRQRGRHDTASLGFVADLYDRNGVPVPFFGQQVKFSPFPALLVRRLNARMWIGRCIRTGKQSRFRVNVVEVKVPRTENEEEDIKTITASMIQQFEQWIRETPGQYMWANKRFIGT
ncbi:MAG: lysophospholipid acyltransferase family protein [Proteobacteria bacterium]|nr:lysophospholipid acyltransferase family protein [Pseudomonadota bacterium]